MAPNRVFFPQLPLNEWIAAGLIDFTGRELLIKAANRRYLTVEAAQIIQEVSGAEDIYDLVGRVKSVTFLTELGAEMLQNSMLLGDNAYEVIPGFLGSPTVPFATYQAETPADSLQGLLHSDEDLLVQYLLHAPKRP